MGHEHEHRLVLPVQFEQEFADGSGARAVQVAGRFIGEQQFGGVNQSPSHGDALAFAAGEFGGAVSETVPEADAVEEFFGQSRGFRPFRIRRHERRN